MHGMKREHVIQQFLLFITGQEGIVEKLHQGFFSDTWDSKVVMSLMFCGSSLIQIYPKCGITEHAKRVFNRRATCDVASWRIMIMGCVKHVE